MSKHFSRFGLLFGLVAILLSGIVPTAAAQAPISADASAMQSSPAQSSPAQSTPGMKAQAPSNFEPIEISSSHSRIYWRAGPHMPSRYSIMLQVHRWWGWETLYFRNESDRREFYGLPGGTYRLMRTAWSGWVYCGQVKVTGSSASNGHIICN